ncbi:hypothetical protein E1263_11480 [Kribbella antibiotica]|uniref:Uncharacterized protein n=1 Tax=Kribbella antibiotica TaxID=190195 RepID=A0A4R4ZR55_9ACTN|nr:hypothetical protein [Kribbella antibiotica]TDD60389.1 hypothetical protein E1263_11480 [Kribbella antibiotica]
MKRLMAGLAALGTTVVALAGAAPAVAAGNSLAFGSRYFDCDPEYGCHGSAVLPKSWKYTGLGNGEGRFTDTSVPRMIRIDTDLDSHPGTATAALNKQKALKGTPGLKIIGLQNGTMKSTMQQGPLRISTLVYTYRSGSQTRWVATRYIGFHGDKTASAEVTVGGRVQDRTLLGTVLTKATESLAMAG